MEPESPRIGVCCRCLHCISCLRKVSGITGISRRLMERRKQYTENLRLRWSIRTRPNSSLGLSSHLCNADCKTDQSWSSVILGSREGTTRSLDICSQDSSHDITALQSLKLYIGGPQRGGRSGPGLRQFGSVDGCCVPGLCWELS